jgi:hypothetical protein
MARMDGPTDSPDHFTDAMNIGHAPPVTAVGVSRRKRC